MAGSRVRTDAVQGRRLSLVAIDADGDGGLNDDEVLLLSDACVAELLDLEQRVAQQRAVLRDSGPGHRWRARRLLRSLQERAALHRAALERLRAGGPHCRSCGQPLPFALLLARPLAAECAACPPWQDRPYESRFADR